MAYVLKYFYDIDRDGHKVRMNIYIRDDGNLPRFSVKIIGGLQSLSLALQGGDNSPESPIVTTALNFSLVDCFDREDGRETRTEGGHVVSYAVKYGGWEEFYTPDSTLYEVTLSVDNSVIWRGFITPDSWEEDLTYRSVLNITARDNIGHLRDFDFDLEGTDGMVRLDEIVSGAVSRCGMRMTLDMDVSDLEWRGTGLVSGTAEALYFCVEGFRDMSWYDALENVLDGLGLVMRYVGDGIVFVRTLRAWSEDEEMERTEKAVLFADSSGHRTLSPAYRRIAETFRPDGDGTIFSLYQREDDYESETLTSIGYTYVPGDGSAWKRTGNIGMINPYAITNRGYRGGFSPNCEESMFLSVFPSISASESSARIARTIKLSGSTLTATLRIGFGALPYSVAGDYEYILQRMPSSGSITTTIHLALKGYRNTDGNVRYYDASTGSWVTTFKEITQAITYGQVSQYVSRYAENGIDMSIDVNLSSMEKIEVWLLGFTITTTDTTITPLRNAYKLYGYIYECSLLQSDTNFPDRKITTIYDDSQTTQLNRTPDFGEITFAVLNANAVKNGIYYKLTEGAYLPVIEWRWAGTEASYKSLPVLVHKQILAYHSKANDVLSGSVIDSTANNPSMGDCFTYGGRRHILAGGNLNLLNGRIESAVLREYEAYSNLWDDSSV